MRLCTTVAMGTTINNVWKLFCYGVKRDHNEKLIDIREFLERLAQDCFNNNFSPDRGTPEKNIPHLDEVNDGDTVSTFRALKFSICINPSSAASTVSNMTLNSASTVSIFSEPTYEKEEAKDGWRYNRFGRGYCSGKLTNVKRCLKRSL